MRRRSLAGPAPGLFLASAVLLATACGSRPIASHDGGDASRDTTGGGTGVGGAAGESGVAGATGTGGGGTAGVTGGAGGAAAGPGRGGDGGATGGNGGTTGGRGGATGGGGGAAGGRGGAAGGRGGDGGTVGGRGGNMTGGRGGAGGTTAPGPECASASDCKLVDDCCTCEAIPTGAAAPACNLTCKQNQCPARQLGAGRVDCIAGRCVAGFACDTSQVICKVATPACPAGEVPTVNEAGTCYTGVCAPASECTTVTACSACAGANVTCVDYVTQLGVQHHCVTIPSECALDSSCTCLGPGSCVSPYRACANYSGIRGINCSCPNC